MPIPPPCFQLQCVILLLVNDTSLALWSDGKVVFWTAHKYVCFAEAKLLFSINNIGNQ